MSNKFLFTGFLDEQGFARQMQSADARRDFSDPDGDDDHYVQEQFCRPLSRENLDDLVSVLEGTDDSIAIGLSQIGLDPEGYTRQDRDEIRVKLRSRKFNFVGGIWVQK